MVVDASVWVSYFVPADRFHAETVAWLEGLLQAGNPLVGPTLLLPEVAGSVARRSTSSELGMEAARQVSAWPTLTLVPPDDDLMWQAAQIAAALPIRGADAVYVAAAQMLGVPLVTWDTEQRIRGGLLVPTGSPGGPTSDREIRRGD